MRLKANHKKQLHKPVNLGLIVVVFMGINLINIAFLAAFSAYNLPSDTKAATSEPKTKTLGIKSTSQTKPNPINKTNPISSVAPPATPVFSHLGITTTVFWVGEDASADNDNIQNRSSAWVEDWVGAYGGIDSPVSRNGYLPAGFTPKENTFYLALPYNDLDPSGYRKSTATKCPVANGSNYSWCKNSWVAVRCNGKIAYGQWEDAGPNGEDDVNYVFGSSPPANQFGLRAGLDVSPALRDYIGLSGENSCDWTFVSASNVPDGPWKQIITTTPSYEATQ